MTWVPSDDVRKIALRAPDLALRDLDKKMPWMDKMIDDTFFRHQAYNMGKWWNSISKDSIHYGD